MNTKITINGTTIEHEEDRGMVAVRYFEGTLTVLLIGKRLDEPETPDKVVYQETCPDMCLFVSFDASRFANTFVASSCLDHFYMVFTKPSEVKITNPGVFTNSPDTTTPGKISVDVIYGS